MLLLVLALAAGDPLPAAPSLLRTASARLSTAGAGDPRPSPYRIADDADESGVDDGGLKNRAVADDGRRCQVIGTRLCTRPPRTWLKAALLP